MRRPFDAIRIARRLLAPALALALAGCASTAPVVRAPGVPLERVALLPLENLATRPESGDLVTRVVYGTMSQTQRCEMVEPGDVEAAMRDLRIRTSGMLTSDQAVKLAARLEARYLLTGTILECGMVRTPDGEVPSVGLTLRMLDGKNGRVTWNAMRVRTGDDHETLFGWGREVSLERLTQRALEDMLQKFPLPAASVAAPDSGGIR
jgi:hypothetical protein